MSGLMIASLQDFLDNDGCLPEELPGPALNIALFLGAIVEWMTKCQPAGIEATNVVCRRKPERRQCTGNIYAVFLPDGSINWECPFCGDNGLIYDWQETGWDRSNEIDEPPEF
ncbi:MAG TPA: hypothetical protein PLV45_01875 [bacterium]|nr:hypothetical protein [bacterium]